jgi:tRNA threonylcarbamoyladenosine biosynthesis protein TsaB
MKLLAIDTSTKFLSVAVINGSKVLASYHRRADMSHSSRLMPTIESVLKKAKVKLADIKGLAISIGPGSFTGLRIGATAVKAMAFALKKPVVAVPTLDAIAENAAKFTGLICPVLDAKKEKVYAALYESDSKRLKRISKYLLMQADELVGKIRSMGSKRVLFLGDGVDVYKERLEKVGAGIEFYGTNWQPRSSVVAALAAGKFKERAFSDIFDLVPLYLYSKECDVKGH